ncbi:glycosyltransferase family 4 protein [Cognatishimia sp. F0-27]|uniref:glycosyltransferase family 4 protein n=1 Tax=Cognatishimia sp. F0-27 TaxID=2816855 RepID=UPI001D0CD7AC|nr:glycosyltransferase family 4 protein [Cognatishimia sp. F0-27]MCC1494839.1 glycosyltransferase family 4 protein [Cognatishimia sp. F0-27]
MHILFLTDNFPPETNAPASRTFEHAREWVALGHRVTVITCAPNFPTGRVFGGYRNRLWQSEQMDGIRVIRVWSYMTGNAGFARRILDFLSFMVMGFFAALFVRRPDVVVGTSPQFFTAVAAWGVAALKRRPFVFELRDIWPDSIRAVSAMKTSRLLDLLERLELFLYRRATLVVAVTQAFRRNLVARGIPADKIVVVTNGVDATRFSPRPKDAALVRELDLRGRFVAGYIGTLGMAHALETVIEAGRILAADPATRDMRLLILGDGAQRTALMARAAGLETVRFLDPVSKEAVVRYWSILDVAIIHLRRTPLFTTVIPSKMFECMGMGLPILHGVEGESAQILTRHDAGLIFTPEDAADLARKLIALRDDPALRARLRANGLVAAAAYDRKALAAGMLAHLEAVARAR